MLSAAGLGGTSLGAGPPGWVDVGAIDAGTDGVSEDSDVETGAAEDELLDGSLPAAVPQAASTAAARDSATTSRRFMDPIFPAEIWGSCQLRAWGAWTDGITLSNASPW
jgi:hypothetical protein